ncbi:MAG: M56 family metallopeptidase, partial [Clostridiales bacterium]|nr:M56 family metallopeptidase [Clostridiales bacterium]
MEKLFLIVLNMSITGAFVIAAICLARLPLKKAPKIISYALWAVAGFRLVFPFSIESVFSLLPFKAQPIPPDIAMQPIPRIDSGIPFVNNAVSSVLPAAAPIDSVNPLQVWTFIGSWIWIIGIAFMLIYGVASFIILKRKMRSSAHVEANIYEAACIQSPFVLGVFAPKIYLPVGLSEHERGYILLHEQTHVRRCDHIVKFAAYFVLCLHWFNPLAWVAFMLMGVDMEMSCDERVLKEMGSNTKKDYSLSLLSLSTERRMIGGSPLAFGEGGVKERVKRVLHFKKPSRVVVVAAIVLVAVLSTGFAVNRAVSEPLIEMKMIYEENPAFFSRDMKLLWGDTVYHFVHIANGKPGKKIGYATDEYDGWHIFELKGYSRDHLCATEKTNDSGLWVFSVYPPEQPWQQYILENATDRDRMMRMLSISLYSDGTAKLATPPISSFAMVGTYYYSFTDGELLIYNDSNEETARFEVVDDTTIIFRTATVP